MTLNIDVGPRVGGVPAIGSSTTSPSGYPLNPAGNPAVDGRPAAGIVPDVGSIAQGIQLMSACVNCGRAFPADQLSSHVQEENESPFRSYGAQFGSATL